MPSDSLVTKSFGPFDGVVDTKGSSVSLPGKLRSAKNLVFYGLNKLAVKSGTALALTLYDDQGTPAQVTRVLAIETFMDGAVAVAHSTVTSKVYLYRLPATMDGWYNAAGALQATLLPQPIGVLWSSMTTPGEVSISEGLGTLYVATSNAIDETAVHFKTRQVTFSSAGVPTFADLAASGTGGSAGADFAYFTAIASFHQHLFGVGYGVGNTAGFTSFRPELMRFSQPSFSAFQTTDSIVVGDRVRAIRERAIVLKVAGNALFLGASKALFRVTGYGRDSWTVETLDQKFGPTGPKAAVSVGGTLYYHTSAGLARCADGGSPEALWDAMLATANTIANESQVVLTYDKSAEQVQATYDSGDGVRTVYAFDTQRNTFVSTAGDQGLVIHCAGLVEPIYRSIDAGPAAPSDPNALTTSSITNSSALYQWTITDAGAQHEVSAQRADAATWTVQTTVDAGVASFAQSYLLASTAYQWRVRSLKNGVYGSYVGPVPGSQFTTLAPDGSSPSLSAAPTGLNVTVRIPGRTAVLLDWTNTDSTLAIQILRSSDGATFTQVGSAVAGASNATNDAGAFGTFYYSVRYVNADGSVGTSADYYTITLDPP